MNCGKVFFTTKSCSLPLTGELELTQMHRLDSARFDAVFFKFSDSQILEFILWCKEKDKKLCSMLPASGNSQFTLKPLLQNATYDIQATVRCPNNPLDSFLLFTTFTAAQDQCTQKPDTTLVRIWFTPGYAHPTLQFSLPKEYKYDFRVKAEEDANYKSYFPNFSGDYNITFSIYPGTNDFQYRVICPNGNISPWSKTIKIIRPEGIVDDLPPQLNSHAPAITLESRPQLPRLLISPNPTTVRLKSILP